MLINSKAAFHAIALSIDKEVKFLAGLRVIGLMVPILDCYLTNAITVSVCCNEECANATSTNGL